MPTRARPYQVTAIGNCREAFRLGATRVLLVMPTGGGKTVVGEEVVSGALAKGLTVLWVTSGRELIQQAASRMPGRVGIIMAGEVSDPLAPVQVASIDTLNSRDIKIHADLIIIDEAHHAVAATWAAIVEANPNARVLGLTATPQRGDGAGLGAIFDTMVVATSVAELTELGWLVPADVIGPTKDGETLAMDPVEAWIKHAEKAAGFIFAATVGLSKEYAARLQAQGVHAEHVDGKTPRKVRDRIIQDFRDAKVDVLSSVGVFTEGVDLPRAQTCILGRHTGSAGAHMQRVGRVLRPAPFKKRALVIDLVGACWRHGLPDDEREWSLDGEVCKIVEKADSITQCLGCGMMWRPTSGRRTCKRCGWTMPEPERPVVKETELIDLREQLKESLRRARETEHLNPADELRKLEATARARGYKEKWVRIRYKEMFNRWPRRVRV